MLQPLMPLQAQASWAQPIDMLYACHSKVKRFCNQLRLLNPYVAEKGVSDVVVRDVKQIIYYFDHGAALHHEDEEHDFFPLLIALRPEAEATVAQLEQEHDAIHAVWLALRAELEALIAGQITRVDETLIAQFTESYDRHIALEEPLFELGREAISADAQTQIGEIMAARRKRPTE